MSTAPTIGDLSNGSIARTVGVTLITVTIAVFRRNVLASTPTAFVGASHCAQHAVGRLSLTLARIRRVSHAQTHCLHLITLDNVIEDPGGMAGFTHGGWANSYFGKDGAERSLRKLQECDYFLCGRRTYEMFSKVWPKSSDPYSDRLNSMPKLVASRTLEEPLTWNARLLHGDVIEALKKIKQEPGKDILMYGSARLMHTLLQHNVVDQLDLLRCPITLGAGQHLFEEDGRSRKFELLDQSKLSSGITILSYRPLPS